MSQNSIRQKLSLKVLTNASVDGYSRITEVEAYGPADTGGSGGLHWLVSDHLGTPRMIFNQSGELENMTRHDYLPFAEELFAPTGGRSPETGYQADDVRQRFTSKERDVGTDLDYFGARYYHSTQGRFTSPDIFRKDSRTSDPQSPDTGHWNLGEGENDRGVIGQVAKHEFAHLLGVGNRAGGAFLSSVPWLRNPRPADKATAYDFGWALGGIINRHRNGSRTPVHRGRQWETPNAGGPGWSRPNSHRSTHTLGAPTRFGWWR